MGSLPKGSAADLRDREQAAKASYERAKIEGCDLQQHRARNAWLRARRAADHADAAVLRDMLLLVDRVAGDSVVQESVSMFKPSHVTVENPPFKGAFHNSECELAVALIVRACQVLGDAWQPMLPAVIGKVGIEEHRAGRQPWVSLLNSPFLRPDFKGLVDRGFACWREDFAKAAGVRGAAIELSPQSIGRLAPWVPLERRGAKR